MQNAQCRCKMSVCLSVLLSICHTPVFCKNGYTYQNFFTIGSQTGLVFLHETGWQYSNVDPRDGGDICMGYAKIMTFKNIWKMMQDRAIVTMEGE